MIKRVQKIKATIGCFLAVLALLSCKTTGKSVPKNFVQQESSKDSQSGGKNAGSGGQEAVKSRGKSVFTPETFTANLQKILHDGDTEKALAAFETIPPEYKDNPDLNYLHASLLLSAGKIRLAAQKTAFLLEKEPEDEELQLLNAMISKADGDNKKSTNIIKSVLKKNPKNADANAALANSFMLVRNFTQANVYFRKGMEADPVHEASLFGFGQTSWYLDKTDKARAAFVKLTEINPQNSMAWSYLAKLSAERRNYSQALEYVQKALVYDQNYYYHWLDAGSYYFGLDNYTEAEKAWSRAIKLEPDYFLAYTYRAALFDEKGRYDEALEDYRNVIRCNPKYYYAYESVAMLAWRVENWEESLSGFLKAWEINPSNISYQLMVSAAYQKLGNTKASKGFLSKNMKNLDKQSLDYFMLRLYYDGLGDGGVLNKVVNHNGRTTKGKMLFYMALFYELKNKQTLANKLYLEVAEMESPLFFEYRLTQWAVEKMNSKEKQATEKQRVHEEAKQN